MKFSTYNIYDDPKIKDFLEMRDLKPSTQKTYVLIIRQYCKLYQKTAEQLINEAREEERAGILKADRKIKKRLIKYRNHLTKNYTSKSVKTRITIIRTFYNEFEIELPRIRLKSKHETLITAEDIPSKEHIRQVLKHCNLKYRAMILTMANSGMGGAEIRNLTNEDFIKSLEITIKAPFDIGEIRQKVKENHIDILTWKPVRQRTDMPYFTFSGPESINAILDYLEQKHKKIPFRLNDWLFGQGNKQTAARSIHGYFEELNDKCGFGRVGIHRFFTAHKLRYYFATTAHKNHAREMDTDWMLGHSIQRILGVYTKPSIPDLKREYRRLLPYLSIEKVESRDVYSQEYRDIVARLEKVELENKEMLRLTKEKHTINEENKTRKI